MAKISAYGETKVAEIRCQVPGTGPKTTYIFVMTSGGRVLTRWSGEAGTNYTLLGRVKDPAKRNRDFLVSYATRQGKIVVPGR